MNGLEITLIVIEIIVFIIWWNNFRYFKNKKKTTNTPIIKNLLKTSIAYLFVPIQMIDFLFLDVLSETNLGYRMSLGYGLAMLASGIGSYFMYSFVLIIFDKKEGTKLQKSIFLVIEMVSTITILICKALNLQSIAYIGVALHLIVNFYLGGYMFIHTTRLVKRIGERKFKISLRLISFAGFSIFISYLMFLIEGVISPTSLSIFGIIGWIFIVCISFALYLGYTNPKWFNKMMKLDIE